MPIEFVRISFLNCPHCRLERLADIIRRLPHLKPVRLLRNLKAVILRVRGEIRIAAGLFQRQLRLLIEDVAKALEKQ